MTVTLPTKSSEMGRDDAVRPRQLVYPVSDGKPMGETGKHINLLVYARSALRLHYADQPDTVYVGANNFLYYEEGNPAARVAPDTFVVFGAAMWERDSYKVWEEPASAQLAVVFEFTSRKTRSEDVGRKFQLYERVLKVPEYVMFDPTGDYLKPRLSAHRLVNGRYVPIPLENDRLWSEQLQLEIIAEGVTMRFFDPRAHRFLPSLDEAEAQRREAEAQRREAEAQRREAEAQAAAEAERAAAAEAEVDRLRAEIEALRRSATGRP